MLLRRSLLLIAVVVLSMSCVSNQSSSKRSRQGATTSQTYPPYAPVQPQYQTPTPQTVACLMADADICEGERLIVQYINEYRAQTNAGALIQDPQISVVARDWSKEQATKGSVWLFKGSIGHRGFPTARLSDYVAKFQAQPSTSFRAENVAMSSGSTATDVARAFATMWYESHEGHKENLLNPSHTHTGVGLYKSGGNYYATQIFSE